MGQDSLNLTDAMSFFSKDQDSFFISLWTKPQSLQAQQKLVRTSFPLNTFYYSLRLNRCFNYPVQWI